jgi:hypothetical protein
MFYDVNFKFVIYRYGTYLVHFYNRIQIRVRNGLECRIRIRTTYNSGSLKKETHIVQV